MELASSHGEHQLSTSLSLDSVVGAVIVHNLRRDGDRMALRRTHQLDLAAASTNRLGLAGGGEAVGLGFASSMAKRWA